MSGDGCTMAVATEALRRSQWLDTKKEVIFHISGVESTWAFIKEEVLSGPNLLGHTLTVFRC